MPFKTILAAFGVDERNEDLVAAADLSARSDAHLKVLVISCLPPSPFGDATGAAYAAWSAVAEAESERLETRTDELRALLVGKGLEAEIEPLYCLRSAVDAEIARRALYADLTVIGSGLGADAFLQRQVLDGALFQSPSPVLMLASKAAATLSPKVIQVAWNSSLEAGKAVRQALPLLMAAEDVRIVLVDPIATSDANGEEPGADIAAYLARHGVNATVDVLPGGGRDAADVLRQHAVDIGAELRIMGGYGHSRLRERIFGGVTRSMAEHADIPVFLAH